MKKPYAAPSIKELGNIEEVTRASKKLGFSDRFIIIKNSGGGTPPPPSSGS